MLNNVTIYDFRQKYFKTYKSNWETIHKYYTTQIHVYIKQNKQIFAEQMKMLSGKTGVRVGLYYYIT